MLIYDSVTQYGPQLVKIVMTKAADQTVNDLLESTENHSRDSQPKRKESSFPKRHRGVLRKVLNTATSAAIPALL